MSVSCEIKPVVNNGKDKSRMDGHLHYDNSNNNKKINNNNYVVVFTCKNHLYNRCFHFLHNKYQKVAFGSLRISNTSRATTCSTPTWWTRPRWGLGTGHKSKNKQIISSSFAYQTLTMTLVYQRDTNFNPSLPSKPYLPILYY